MSALEEEYLLRDYRDVLSEGRGLDLLDLGVVYLNLAAYRVVEAVYQVRYGRFAGAGVSDETHVVARLYVH